jgi:hypothetical protein
MSPAAPHTPAQGFMVGSGFVAGSSFKIDFHMHVAPFSVENNVRPSSDTSIKLKSGGQDGDLGATSVGSESGNCLTLLSFHTAFPVEIKINPPEFTLIEVMIPSPKTLF